MQTARNKLIAPRTKSAPLKGRTVTVQPAAAAADDLSAASVPMKSLSRQRFDSKKFANPFATTTKHRTPFGEASQEGKLPFRLQHGMKDMHLAWTMPIEHVNLERLLPLCFEGLREKQHPYDFLAKQAIAEVLDTPQAADRVPPLLPQLIPSLKLAVNEKDMPIFLAAADTLSKLSDVAGPALDPHLNQFLTVLNKRMSEKKNRELVEQLLTTFLQNGGPEVPKIIKSKIPTFTCM